MVYALGGAPTAPEVIIIADWQAYLCYWHSPKG